MPSGLGLVTRALPRTAGSAERRASAVAPACWRIVAACDDPAAIPRSRCAVETYSSPSAWASFAAASSAADVARDGVGCATAEPLAVGSATSAARTFCPTACLSAPTASRSPTATPPSCVSSAARRWVGSSWGLPAADAVWIASPIACCDIVVNFVSIGAPM